MIDDRDTPFPVGTSAQFRRRMLLVVAAVLGETDLDAFQRRWNQFVLQLSVPELHWVDGKGYQP